MKELRIYLMASGEKTGKLLGHFRGEARRNN